MFSNNFGTGKRIEIKNHITGKKITVLDVEDKLLATTMHVYEPTVMQDRWLKYFLNEYSPADESNKELINNRKKAAYFMLGLVGRYHRRTPIEFYLERLLVAYNLYK
jgi:hypothetical protein